MLNKLIPVLLGSTTASVAVNLCVLLTAHPPTLKSLVFDLSVGIIGSMFLVFLVDRQSTTHSEKPSNPFRSLTVKAFVHTVIMITSIKVAQLLF